jgi:DNA-binding response OmpR family regulator
MGNNLMSKSHAKSILIVENDDNLRKAIGKFLAKGGYHVTGVSDARSAMLVCRGIVRPVNSSRTRLNLDPNLLRQPPESDIGNNSTKCIIPDCLVLDIQLSGSMDGLGLLKVIRSDPLLTSLPVVLLTAKGKVEDRIIGYESDADAYLPKPFEPDELQSIIDGLLRRDKKLSTSRDARGGTTEGFGNTKTNTVYGELKRELMEIKALLNLNAPIGMSVVTGDSLQRDISEIKDRLKGLADQIPQDAKPMKDQYDTFSILSPGELLHALMISLLCY